MDDWDAFYADYGNVGMDTNVSPTEQDVLDAMVEDYPEPPGYSTDNEAANQQAVEEAVAADNALAPKPGDEEGNEAHADEYDGDLIAEDIADEEEVDIGTVEQAQVDLGEFL